MKKIALLLAVVLIFSFTGCTELTENGGVTTENANSITTTTTISTELSETEGTTVTTTEKTTIVTTVETKATTVGTTTKKTTAKTTTAQTEAPSESVQEMVWIPASGTKYHSNSSCSNMKNPSQVSLSVAQQRGFTACKKCY